MLTRLRQALAAAGRSLRKHRWAVAGATLGVVAIAAGIYVAASGDDGDPSRRAQPAPAPQVVVREVAAPERTEDLGFPAFATKNTTRVAGAEAPANAAGAALAVFPSAGGIPGPDAVTLVDAGEWQAGIAAASLVAAPVSAPVLITADGEPGELTEAALAELDPKGSAATAGREAFVIGAAAAPDGLETLEVEGGGAAELAAEVDKLRERLAGKPEHILVASSDEPGYAMPAAAWAARSGDPVLFAERDRVPEATLKALRRHDGVPVFVLGPPDAISAKALKEIERVATSAERVGAGGRGRERDRVRPLFRRQLRLEHQRPGARARARALRPAARRRRRGAALRQRHLGTAAPERRGRPAARGAALLPAGPQAGVRGRPDPRRLQPRLADRRPRPAVGRPPGAGGRARRGRPGNVRVGIVVAGTRARDTGIPARAEFEPEPVEMSESERPDRLSGRRITVEDVRALAGPSTPHFALQIRNRIQRLIAPLPPDDPARVEGERQVARLTQLAQHSGDPRSDG